MGIIDLRRVLIVGILLGVKSFCISAQDFKELYRHAYNNINSNPREALKAAIDANNQAKITNDIKQLAKSFFLIGYLHKRDESYSEALYNYYEALKYYRKLEDEKLISDALLNIGVIFHKTLSYKNAIYFFEEAAAIKERQGEKELLAGIIRNLAKVYRETGQYDSALIMNANALELYNSLDDKNMVSIVFNEIGINLKELEKYNKAIDYYFKALLVVEGTKFEPSRRAKTYNNAGNAYLLQENFIKAKSYFTKAIDLKESIPGFDIESKMSTLNNLGEIYKQENNIDSSKYFYERSLAIAVTKDPRNKELKVCLEELKSIAENEGDLRKEIEYLKLLTETYNSLLDDKLNYQRLYSFQEIQTALYRIQKQERDVLMQQQRKTNLLIYGLIAICFGLIVAMMFIYTSRRKKVKKRLVEELNEML